MTNIIAPPTLEELNERIVAIEDLRNTWRDLPSKTPFDIELYCLYAVRDGVAASEQSLSEAERHAVEHARWQVRKATPDNPDCCFDYQLVKNLLDVIDRKNPQSPWMDIETAPKDGTIIIGRGPWRFGGDKEFVALAIRYNSDLGIWQRDNDGYGYTVQCHPTFWMSLPAPPTHNSPPEERRCQKCGCKTGSEEALVRGQIWCHPCADKAPHNLPPDAKASHNHGEDKSC